MKKILVTCANSNMGSAIAKRLSDEHSLVLGGRDTRKLNQMADGIGSDNIECLHLDFFNEASIDQFAHACDSLDGIVFIIPRIPPSSDVFPDDQQWKELFEKYFILPLRLLKRISESGAMNRGCKVVIISGLSSKSALSHYAINNCIRSAWVGQAKTMALSLGEKAISVNTLSLGGVMTQSYTDKMHQKALSNGLDFDTHMKNEVSNIPLQKYASVDDVTDSVIALLGPLANHMTGQNILLDGGFSKAY